MTGWALGAVLWLLATLPVGFHGYRLSRADLTRLVAVYPDWPVTRMVDTFECESQGFTRAVSPTGDLGIPQIHVATWYRRFVPRWLFIPQYAIWAAHEIWLVQGEDAWVCARGGRSS